MDISQVIKKPILTEKTYQLMDQDVYTFRVDKRANKIEIAKAVETIWGVKVSRVNVINVNRKPKRLGRFAGFTSGYKKAIIKVSEGRINFFPDDETQSSKKLKADEPKTKIVDVKKAEKAKALEAKVAAKLAAKKAAKESK